ncbi:OmpA family protein [Massilia sp. MB5]|uniref:flagellar motor protein MotB n=1 Tax=unclassified Massilia TaxID=2609279 RepID=UPI00067BD713|nr:MULTISPECIES: flagellar motor protein MotB [unclassified Massilia]AKU24636.1 histidine kinase [Massilia sp. NR 4-1]UMR29888.1 OmpA family protein [Massilia sp. MB5]
MLKPHDKHHEATIVKRGGGKHKHDEHGGAWKVAFADFCLALMCLFLVLWLMASRNTESLEQILTEADGNKTDQGKGVMPQQIGGPRGSLIERFPMTRTGNTDAPGNATQSTQTNPQAQPERVSYDTPNDLQQLAKALGNMSEEAGLASNLESVVTPYGLRVMLHDTDEQGMFVRGSAVPTGKFQALMRKMGPLFAKMENQMLIVGHTDSLQYADTSHSAFSNWNLSSNRAMSARAQLLAGSMPTDSVLQVVGMADRAPLDVKNATAGINRRIELLILTKGQAAAISAMFGMPGKKSPLTLDVDSELPDVNILQQLRNKLLPGAKGNGNGH